MAFFPALNVPLSIDTFRIVKLAAVSMWGRSFMSGTDSLQNCHYRT